MPEWVIDQEARLEREWREKWGDEEYGRRKKIAAEKREAYPDSQWEAQVVLGNQFEPLAMQCSQEIFDKLAERDYRFWGLLVSKVVGC